MPNTYTPGQMAEAIRNLPLGTDVSDTTAVASDVLAGKDFYLANGTTYYTDHAPVPAS